MVFIETSLFAKYRSNYLNDEAYREFQNFLMQQPEAGNVIQGTGGLRKLRFYLMTVYSKNEMVDLSAQEKKLLKQLLQAW